MQAFKSGETRVLVATKVVEVGVDVPEASVMVIENAERFGARLREAGELLPTRGGVASVGSSPGTAPTASRPHGSPTAPPVCRPGAAAPVPGPHRPRLAPVPLHPPLEPLNERRPRHQGAGARGRRGEGLGCAKRHAGTLTPTPFSLCSPSPPAQQERRMQTMVTCADGLSVAEWAPPPPTPQHPPPLCARPPPAPPAPLSLPEPPAPAPRRTDLDLRGAGNVLGREQSGRKVLLSGILEDKVGPEVLQAAREARRPLYCCVCAAPVCARERVRWVCEPGPARRARVLLRAGGGAGGAVQGGERAPGAGVCAEGVRARGARAAAAAGGGGGGGGERGRRRGGRVRRRLLAGGAQHGETAGRQLRVPSRFGLRRFAQSRSAASVVTGILTANRVGASQAQVESLTFFQEYPTTFDSSTETRRLPVRLAAHKIE